MILHTCRIQRGRRGNETEMSIAELNSISQMLEESSMPSWVREYLIDNEEAVEQKLNRGEEVKIPGPRGTAVTLRPAA
jgi:hypothetical protein